MLAEALLQSACGTPGLGNLEVAALLADHVDHDWRDDQSFVWSGPTVIAGQAPVHDPLTAGVWHAPYASGVVAVHTAQLHTGKVLFFHLRGAPRPGEVGGPRLRRRYRCRMGAS